MIDWDITLYYSYLPAIFVYDDLRFEDQFSEEWTERHFQMQEVEGGHSLVKMTAGLAALHTPFFLIAHWLAQAVPQWPPDGFSYPYRLALLFSCLFYVMLGLNFLRLNLKRFVSPRLASWTVVLLFLGSNLPYYTFVEPMSHGYGFFLSCLLFWAYLRYRDNWSWTWALVLGLGAGFHLWLRPTNALFWLFPLLHFLLDRPKIPRRFFLQLPVMLLLMFLVVTPQFFYWHHMTGKWLVYSYGQEGFFFSDPKIWQGIFSYRKGWWLYSPLFWLLPLAFVPFFRYRPKWAAAALLGLGVALWVTFSWWCWWYGGGFGARALIEYLPLTALPLAFLLQFLSRLHWRWQVPAYLLLAFAAHWSLTMQKQYFYSIIHWDSMSKELYWEQFYTREQAERYWEKLDAPDYRKALENEA